MAPDPNYGAIAPDTAGGGDADNHSAANPNSETTGLLPHQRPSSRPPQFNSSTSHQSRPFSSLAQYFSAPISHRRTDLVLLFQYIITGLLDSSSTLVWGSFVSMQTGNTVYLGSGVVSAVVEAISRAQRPPSSFSAPAPPPYYFVSSSPIITTDERWVRALISILSFMAGSFAFSRYHRHFSPSKRWVLVSAATIQLVMTTIAAGIVTLGRMGEIEESRGRNPFSTTTTSSAATTARETHNPIDVWIALPIALVAFQGGGQAFVSRVCGFKSLTGAVLTSTYLDLAADPDLFAVSVHGSRTHPERNRKLAAVCLMLLGAVLGGVWAQTSVGMMGALWTAVGLKVGVLLAWVFWAAEKEDPETGSDGA